jgi:hypothetical protein
MDKRDQPYMSQITANSIQKLMNTQKMKKDGRRTYKENKEAQGYRLSKYIKNKIEQNQLIVTKAVKGNNLVIIHKEDYNSKVEEFITNNNYTKLSYDITNKLQRSIKNRLNNCNNIINKNNKWKYSNMNPKAPQIYGTVKLHTEHKPVRPVVNWRNSPGYKLAKYIATQLSEKLRLPYICNVKDSIKLIHNLENIQIDENTKLRSFDITNMYTNIPVSETKYIIS